VLRNCSVECINSVQQSIGYSSFALVRGFCVLVTCYDPLTVVNSHFDVVARSPLFIAFGVAKSSTTLAMAMQSPEIKKGAIAAMAGAMPAVLASTAAVASEGTGEWFGVDDLRLLGVLFLGHWFILTLWLQQYGNSDEDEDFFGEIDYTQVGKK
jgi:hypothetical protein